MSRNARSNPYLHTLDFPYKVRSKKGPRKLPPSPAATKILQRLNGLLARQRDLEARRIASEAVKDLKLDEDKPL